MVARNRIVGLALVRSVGLVTAHPEEQSQRHDATATGSEERFAVSCKERGKIAAAREEEEVGNRSARPGGGELGRLKTVLMPIILRDSGDRNVTPQYGVKKKGQKSLGSYLESRAAKDTADKGGKP